MRILEKSSAHATRARFRSRPSWCSENVSDPLGAFGAVSPSRGGEKLPQNAAPNLPLLRGRRERSEQGGRSYTSPSTAGTCCGFRESRRDRLPRFGEAPALRPLAGKRRRL